MDQPRVTLKVRNRAKNGQNDTTPSGPTSQDKHDLDQSVHLDPNPVVCGLLDTVHSTHESEAPTIFQQWYTLAQLQPMVDFLTNYADGLSSECFFNTPISLSGPSTKENIHVDLHDRFFSMPAER